MPYPCKPERKAHPAEGQAREAHEPPGRPGSHRFLSRLVSLALLAAAVTALVGDPLQLRAVVYQAGDIAREDVKARRDFLVADAEATETKRQEAEAASPSVYDRNPNALTEALGLLARDLASLDGDQAGPEGPLPFDGDAAAARLRALWEIPVQPALARRLAEASGQEAFLAEVRAALDPLFARGVAANRRLLLAEGRRGLVVRDLATRAETPLEDPSRVVDFDEGRKGLMEAAGAQPLETLARRVAGVLLRPDLTLNSEETAARRAAARQAVKPVLYQILRGEMLVREGDRVSPEQARKLEAYASLAPEAGAWRSRLGLLFLTALALAVTWRFAQDNVKKFRGGERDLMLLVLLGLAMLALERIGLALATGLVDALPGAETTALTYAVPLVGAVIAARVLFNSETAILFALPFYAFAALPFEHSLAAFCCFMVGGMVGAHRAARACRRLDFLRAGLAAGVAQAAVVASLVLMKVETPGVADAWWLAGAFAGGALGGVVALCLVPLAEAGLGFTTEMRLMELASLDHPLLRELMLRAPGTYHHSVVTGSLVKAAAEAIGARALLASVAAYYHDIGKVSKPAYFIENQTDTQNRHDKLAPSMSSLILLSHVKEGVELARRHRLGRDIIDIIQQHHGTSLIRYFYEKACRQSRDGVGAVSDSDYRYPGPRPRSREAALVLLADAVEAACRTVADPRPARIRGAVQNIVNRTFTDGQLDECDLTLSDLHEIARSFSRILCAIHHQRIDYPLAAEKEKAPDADLDPKRLRGSRHRRGQAAEADGERLRRLGM